MSCFKSPIKKNYVRHACDKTPFSFSSALFCAWKGLGCALTTQRNFKIHFFFAVLAVLLGFILQISQIGWIAIVLCIGIVFALEVVNTAIEFIVDLVSPEWNELAMCAKDCAAAAVLIAAITSVVIATIVYIPKILQLVSAFN